MRIGRRKDSETGSRQNLARQEVQYPGGLLPQAHRITAYLEKKFSHLS